MRIGPGMFDGPTGGWERWGATTATERVQIFLNWLGDACNKESLLIIDDLEAFGYSNIELILKYPAWHIVVSTRDSELMRSDRHCEEVQLSCLSNDETIKVLVNTFFRINSPMKRPFHPNELKPIADKIQGHPLAARNAISFILTQLSTYSDPFVEFLNLLDNSNPEDRKAYFKYMFEGRSLWDAFHTSLDRLQALETTGDAAKLIQVLSFLCIDRDCIDDLLKLNKHWLSAKDLPDVAVLKGSYLGNIASWLSNLRRVSFYIKGKSLETVKKIDVHPLILEYVLLRLEEQSRTRLASQILQLCFKLEVKGVDRNSQLIPHVMQCIKVCKSLGISLNDLKLPNNILQWVNKLLSATRSKQGKLRDRNLLPLPDPPSAVATVVKEFGTRCEDAYHVSKRHEHSGSSDGMIKMIVDCTKSYREVRRALDPEIRVDLSDSLRKELENSVASLRSLVISRSNNPRLAEELEGFMKELKCTGGSG